MPTILNDAPLGGSQAELVKQLNAVVVDLTALKATFDAHTHGGVTAGGAASGAPSAAYIAQGANSFNPTVQKITLLK